MSSLDQLAIGDNAAMIQLALAKEDEKQIESADKLRKTRFAPMNKNKGDRYKLL